MNFLENIDVKTTRKFPSLAFKERKKEQSVIIDQHIKISRGESKHKFAKLTQRKENLQSPIKSILMSDIHKNEYIKVSGMKITKSTIVHQNK